MMKPPTMLLVAATMAMVPRMSASVDLALAGEDDGAHNRNGIQRIGQRHQRRMQQRRDPANHLESDECRKNKDIEAVDEIGGDHYFVSFAVVDCETSVGSE